MAYQVPLCSSIGIHQFQTRRDGPNLQKRLLEPAIQKYIMKELQEVSKLKGATKQNKMPRTIKYLMGQGISVDTPEQASDLLLKREYPDVYNNLSGFGTITIPETFIPSISKIIDKDLIDKLDEETRKRYQDKVKKFPGDFSERIAFQAIKDYYKEKKNTVIVQGLEIINLSKPSQHRESDFIIVNVDKKYVLNLEVKNFLGTWIWNQGKSTKAVHTQRTNGSKTEIKKAKKQEVR